MTYNGSGFSLTADRVLPIPDNEASAMMLGVPTPGQLCKNVFRTTIRTARDSALNVLRYVVRDDLGRNTTSVVLNATGGVIAATANSQMRATTSLVKTTAKTVATTALKTGALAALAFGGVAAVGVYTGRVTTATVANSHRQFAAYLEDDNGVDQDCVEIEKQDDTLVDDEMPKGIPHAPPHPNLADTRHKADSYRPGGRKHLRRRKLKRFVNAAKAKYPNLIEHNNEATRASVHRYINRKMQEKGMRPSQIKESLPLVLELCFIPTPVEIYAAKIRKSRHARVRLTAFHHPPGPFRQAVHDFVENLGPGISRWALRRVFDSGSPGYSVPQDF